MRKARLPTIGKAGCQFDEEVSGDITANTQVMGPDIYSRKIDVRKETIAPALKRRLGEG